MKLFYGTGNASKLRNMRALIEGLPVELVSPLETGKPLPYVDEDGKTPWENAKKKAIAYYQDTGLPAMGLDSGLFFEGVPKELQPGTHVRRVGDRYLNDEALIEYYSDLAKRCGGKLKARFVNGLCVVINEACIKCSGGVHISTDWFWIVSQPHRIRIEGFPMDSIAVDPETGKYWAEADLEDEQSAKGNNLAVGVRQFFTELLKGDYHSNIVEEVTYE